jgi:TolA-binding protein
MTPEDRERYDRIDHQLEYLVRVSAEHTQQIEQHSRQIQEVTGEIRELGGYLTRLARFVQDTHERLNAVIATVERHFSNGKQ